jgi:hypothetical protein
MLLWSGLVVSARLSAATSRLLVAVVGVAAVIRQRAQQEGGLAAFVRSRLGIVPTEFAGELDRAIGLSRYFASRPDGFRPDAPVEFASMHPRSAARSG